MIFFYTSLTSLTSRGEGEGARERRARREGGRGKTGENRRKRAKTRGKRAGNKKGGKGKRKEGKTSLKMVILEGKLSQNRVREGIWEAGGEGGREFGCLSRRRRPKKNIIARNRSKCFLRTGGVVFSDVSRADRS